MIVAFVALMALSIALGVGARKQHRKHRALELWRRSKATQLNKSLRRPSALHPHRPSPSPDRRWWHSPNSNRRAIQARINQLRQIHPTKSDAWLWEQAYKAKPDKDPFG